MRFVNSIPVPDRYTLLLAGLAALGAALVLARQATYGAALHDDSINYIAVARNLLEGEGFANYREGIYKLWPPLYPALLAAASLGVWDPMDIAGPLNAVLFGLTVFVVGAYLRRRVEARFLRVWGTLAVALSIPLTELAAWALAGMPFILLTTLALIQTDKFLREGKTANLLWAALLGAVAWQVRYVGVAGVAIIGLLLLMQTGANWRQRAGRIGLVIALTGLPMAGWLLRVYWATGNWTLFGNRPPVDYAWPAVLRDILAGIGSWVVNLDRLPAGTPLTGSAGLESAAGLLLALSVVGLGIVAYLFCREPGGKTVQFDWQPVYVFGGFGLAYLVMLALTLLSGVWQGVIGVAGRYLTPLYIPLLITAVVGLDWIMSRERERRLLGSVRWWPAAGRDAAGRLGRTFLASGAARPSLLAVILMGGLGLWLALQVGGNIGEIGRANGGGLGGYAAPPWSEDTVARYIRDNPLDGPVYSNLPIVVYLHNRGTAAYEYLPRFRREATMVVDEKVFAITGAERLAAGLAAAPVGSWVVWFNNRWDNSLVYDYGPAELAAAVELELAAERADGAVYRVVK